jgi:hypothetical protein
MWIGKEMKRNFHDKFDIIYALQSWPNMRWYVDVSICEIMPKWINLINFGLEIMWKEAFTANLKYYVDYIR